MYRTKMVFRTKRRKGRAATTATSKRSSRETEQTAAPVILPEKRPKDVETRKSPSSVLDKVPEEKKKVPEVKKVPKLTKKPKPPRVRTDLNDQEIEMTISPGSPQSVDTSTKWGDRSPLSQKGANLRSKSTETEGFETILGASSPKHVGSNAAFDKKRENQTNPTLETAQSKTSQPKVQPRRGFFRSSSRVARKSSASPSPSFMRSRSSSRTRIAKKEEKGLKIVEPEGAPRNQSEGKKDPPQAPKKPPTSSSSSMAKPPLNPTPATKPPFLARMTSLIQGKGSMINNGDASTGLKIVVFDNEKTAERRVRVTLLDTNQTVNLQGEKIEPFLSVILREAVKMNQNIHIENGNFDDSLSTAATSVPVTKTVSYVKKQGSETPPKKGVSQTFLQKFAAKEIKAAEEEQLASFDTYVKRVSSLSKDDDSLLQEVSSIVGGNKVAQDNNLNSGRDMAQVVQNRTDEKSRDIGVQGKASLNRTQSSRASDRPKPPLSPAPRRPVQVAASKNSHLDVQQGPRMKDPVQTQGTKKIVECDKTTVESVELSTPQPTPRRSNLTWAEMLGIVRPASPASTDFEESTDESSLDTREALDVAAGELIRASESVAAYIQSSQSAAEQIGAQIASASSEISKEVVHETSAASRAAQEFIKATDSFAAYLRPRDIKAEPVRAVAKGTSQTVTPSKFQQFRHTNSFMSFFLDGEAEENTDGRPTESSAPKEEAACKSQDQETDTTDPCSNDLIQAVPPPNAECTPRCEANVEDRNIPAGSSMSTPGDVSNSLTKDQTYKLMNRTLAAEETDDNSAIAAIQTGMLLAKQLGLLQGSDGEKSADAVLELAKQIVGSGGLERIQSKDLQGVRLALEASPHHKETPIANPSSSSHDRQESVNSLDSEIDETHSHQSQDEEFPSADVRVYANFSAKTRVLPVVETVLSISSYESTDKEEENNDEQDDEGEMVHSDPNLAVSQKQIDAEGVKNSLLRGISLTGKKNAKLRVIPMERATKAVELAVEQAVQTAVQTALVDELSYEEDDDDEEDEDDDSSTLFTEEASDEDTSSSFDSNTMSSGFLGSEDLPEDDTYLNAYSAGNDDSTLGTAGTLEELLTWAQSHAENPDDIVVSFSEGFNRNTRSVSVVSEAKNGAIEIIDELEIDESIDGRAVSIKGAPSHATKSVMSEENGYSQYEEQTTPLMEAFVFYIESTLEKMNRVKNAKRATSLRGRGKVDGNLTYVSEGLLQSFVKIMGKEENQETGESNVGGGRGLASTEPVQQEKPKPKKDTDDWGEIVQSPSDDMVRSAFGLLTSALTEEMSDFPPVDSQASTARR